MQSETTVKSKAQRLLEEFPSVSTQQWEAVIEKDLKGADYAKKLLTKTFENITLKPYYRSEDLEGLAQQVNNLPGEFPYVRARQKMPGTVAGAWGIRQDIVCSDIQEANKLAIHSLERGATEIGFCSTLKEGNQLEGLAIQSQEQMDQLLEGIYLDCAPIHFNWGANSPAALAMLVNNVEKRGFKADAIQGSLTYDPLNDWITGVTGAQSPDSMKSSLVGLFKFAQEKLPQYRVLSVQGQPFHNAGASAIEELAGILSASVEYIDALTAEGLKLDDILPRMGLSVAVSSKYLMEIAKIRALRLLWSNLIAQYGDEHKALATKTPIHAETSVVNKTRYDVNVNLLRSTMEAMAASVAGCESITVRPFDEPFHAAGEFSYRLARNIQVLLQSEAHLGKVVDPAGGSYALESLTAEIATKAWEQFLSWEESGGFVKAAQSGLIQEKLAAMRSERMKRLSQRRDVILGTSQFPDLSEQILKRVTTASTVALEGAVNAELADKSLSDWQAAFASGAKLGEVAFTSSESAAETLPLFRWAETFESLRLKTEQYQQKTGNCPKVFLMTMGHPAMRTARASFISNFFGCAGFEILNHTGFATVDDAMNKVKETQPQVVVLCSSDPDYGELGPQVAEALKAQYPDAIRVIAGNPTEHLDALKAAGFDDFIHVKTNLVDCLTQYQEKLGVSL